MVDHWIKSGLQLRDLFGDYPIGMILLKCYLDGHAGQTVDTISTALGGFLSDDTVRRRVSKIVLKGTVTANREHKQTVYKMVPAVAVQALAIIRGTGATI
jgi:hypothetical protein